MKERSWSDRLNFIIAVCAVLISAASFYATYLQAESSEKQVKAMTLPLLKFSHGNWDHEQNRFRLQLQIINAGAGPAVLQRASFSWKGTEYTALSELLKDCCSDSYKAFLKNEDVAQQRFILTSTLENAILPGMQELRFFEVSDKDNSHPFWQEFNKVRFGISATLCYCSLLGDCYQSQGVTRVTEVKQCGI